MSAADVIGILSFALHVTHKVYDTVQEVRKAPEEIKALQDQVRNVRELLEVIGIKPPGTERGRDDESQAELRQLVQLSGRGEELLAAANKFIERSTLPGKDGTRKVKKMRWLLKSSKAKELAEDFSVFHRSLTDVCSVNVYTSMRSMESRVSAVGQTTIAAMDRRITRAVEHEIKPAIERLFDEERIAQILVRSLTIVAQQQREGRHQLFDELSTRYGDHNDRHERLAGFLSLTPESIDSRDRLRAEPRSSNLATDSRMQPMPTNSLSRSTDIVSSQSLLSLHPISAPLKEYCPLDCRCRCHKQSSTYRLVPHALRSWFGDIRAHEAVLTALTSSARPCDDVKCIQTRESLSVIKWYLPTLFGRIYAEVELQSIPVNFIIQTPRVVKSLGLLYDISFDELKIKLSTREITINDVNSSGYSLLHRIAYRIALGSKQAHDMMRYLVDAGAPRDWEYRGLTVTEYLVDSSPRWFGDKALAVSALESFEYNIARPLLWDDMEDAWERMRTKRKWSDLHYLLANPPSSPKQLQTQLIAILGQPDAALHLNTRDSFGRTPLMQAIRSCPSAIDVLLRAGASPYLTNVPLVDAARALCLRAIGTLVCAGVDVNKPCHWSEGEISVALAHVPRWWSWSESGRTLPVAVELVRHAGHSLDWDAKDELGRTPLDWAKLLAQRGPDDEEAASLYRLYRMRKLPSGAQFISKSSLDTESGVVANLGSTSLIKAGLSGDIEVVGALIDAGAMVNERDDAGRTLLHLVAMGVVPNNYAIALELVRHGGYGVDWDALTVDGETAEDLANESLRLVSLEDKDRWRETLAILHLLQCRVLPEGTDYVYPCMHPKYCRECCALPCSGYCRDGLRMPGQW